MSAHRPTAKQRMIGRVLDRLPEVTARVVARARAEMPGYAELSAVTIARSTETILTRLAHALLDAHPLTPDDLAAIRDFGETRAHQGISLAEIQNGWRIAIREILAELTAAARAAKTADRLLLDMTTDLLDLVDQATIAYSAGHRDVEIALARNDEQFRADFTRALLLGTLSPADLQVRAQQFELDPEGEYCAYRARIPADEPTPVVSQRKKRSVQPSRPFTTTIDGDLAGFVEITRRTETPTPIAYGPPTRLADLDRSFRLATRILTTAQLFDLPGPLDLDHVGLLPAIAADTDLGAELARRYLDPLGHTETAQTLIATTACFLDTGMRVDTTADRLVVHPNTVRYRLSRFEELTATNLRSAGTALQIWWAIQYRRATSHD
ncbi:PucR family transcriptional regulator [Nocardia yamanashiensis]|uniref:PucR family transcriptional regulator n=1 Tax=Nocardia yamanashiensis TaxID=209247 RepID=UPI000833AC7C|nr:PucR family transcriptional regulator [Nocardia yamanashiensis]